MSLAWWRPRRRRVRELPERGSAILFALFACLAVAMAIQGLTLAVLCGERALADEAAGRERLAVVDSGLAAMSIRAADEWVPSAWASWRSDMDEMKGRLVGTESSQEWVLRAEVAEHPTSADSCRVGVGGASQRRSGPASGSVHCLACSRF